MVGVFVGVVGEAVVMLLVGDAVVGISVGG